MDPDVAVRYSLGLVMLGGALIPDLLRRRVPNQWWIPFATVAVLLDVGSLASNRLGWMPLAVGLVLCAAFYGMWHLGLFGGADAKALMVLALLVPEAAHAGTVPMPPAFDAVANGTLLLLALPPLLFLYNGVRGHWAPVMWLGTRMELADAEGRHVWPMQWVDQAGKLRWRVWQSIGLDLATTYAGLRGVGARTIWATPKIPFIGALLLGLAVSWKWGNLIFIGLVPFFS